MKWKGVVCCCLMTLLLTAFPLLAQQSQVPATPPAPTAIAATSEVPKAVAERLNQLEHKVAAAQSSADNAWMLVSAALVLLMTGPGLALFYGGLVRKKNVGDTLKDIFGLH